MQFNDLFDTPESAQNTIQMIYRNIVIQNNPVVISDVVVEQPKYGFNDCIAHSQSYNYVIHYVASAGTLRSEGTLQVPKMNNGSYLTRNIDGKYMMRTPINIAQLNKDIGSFKDFIRINRVMTIYNIFSKEPHVIFNDRWNEERVAYSFKGYLNTCGIDSSEFDHPTEGGIISVVPDSYGKYFVVDESMKDSINYYLGVDLPKVNPASNTNSFEHGYALTGREILAIYSLGVEHQSYLDRIIPFDLKFYDPGSSILNHIENNQEFRSKIYRSYNRTHIEKNKRIRTDYAQRFIDSYFNMQSIAAQDLQSARDTNAVDKLGQSRKLYIKDYMGRKVALDYGPDFVGLIDPVKTHEGANTSIRNELSRDVVINQNKIFIRVINPDNRELIELPLSKYFNSKIVSSTSWDYDKWEPVLDADGNIQCQYRGEFIAVSEFDYDYIRTDKDAHLTYGSALIPFVNRTDSVRIAMATAMIDQSIPVVGSMPSIVATGIESEIFDKSIMTVKSRVNGKVIDILRDRYIKILTDEGKEVVYTVPLPESSTSGTNNFYTSNVKIGDQVKEGQVIISCNSFQNNQFATTVPLNIAYTSFKAYEFEDGIVISREAAAKLGHLSMETLSIPIRKSESFIFNRDYFQMYDKIVKEVEINDLKDRNQFNLPNIGDTVCQNQILFMYLAEVTPEEEGLVKMQSVLGGNYKKRYAKHKFVVPSFIELGTITGIRVILGKESNEFTDAMHSYYETENEIELHEVEDFMNYEMPHSPEYTIVDEDCIALIQIDIKYINKVKVGDKLCNRFGSKGLVCKIMDDDEVPVAEDGTKVDIIMSNESVVNRKNVSQLFESFLGFASKKAWKVCASLLIEQEYDKVREILNTLYVTDRFNRMSNDDLVLMHSQFRGYYQLKVAAFDNKYGRQAIENISKILDVPLDQKQYLTIKGRRTNNPVVVGTTGIMRLHFIAEHKAKASSGSGGGNSLVLGMGETRRGGQKIGNQEFNAIVAKGNLDAINYMVPAVSEVSQTINQNFLALGLILNPED